MDAFPSIEQVRLVSSGTEAAMTAVRLARGATSATASSSSPAATTGTPTRCSLRPGQRASRRSGCPDSAGVTSGATADTIVAPYNDLESVARAVERYGEGLACVIVEPVAGEHGRRPARARVPRGAARRSATRAGALLVFDEVITGFRIARGGAQERLGVAPDLTCSGRSSAAGFRSAPSAARST